jgi:hypothetical protein
MKLTSHRHTDTWWLALISALLAATLVAPQAAAKTGVEARLDAPLPRDVEPGTTVIVSWTLGIIGAPGETLYGSPIFLRVHTGDGQTFDVRSRETPGRPGHYVARFQATSGGVARIEIGVRGQACQSDGSCGRSDWMFPIVEPSSGRLPDTDTLQPQRGSSDRGPGTVWPLIAVIAMTALTSTFVILSHMKHRLKGWNRD